MMDHDGGAVPSPEFDSFNPLAELASGFIAPEGAMDWDRLDGLSDGGEGDGTLRLSLRDIVTDTSGSAVIEQPLGVHDLLFSADETIAEVGVADDRFSADGTDLTGLAYVAFSSGKTVYYPASLSLSVDVLDSHHVDSAVVG